MTFKVAGTQNKDECGGWRERLCEMLQEDGRPLSHISLSVIGEDGTPKHDAKLAWRILQNEKKGGIKDIRVDQLIDMADALGVSISDILFSKERAAPVVQHTDAKLETERVLCVDDSAAPLVLNGEVVSLIKTGQPKRGAVVLVRPKGARRARWMTYGRRTRAGEYRLTDEDGFGHAIQTDDVVGYVQPIEENSKKADLPS